MKQYALARAPEMKRSATLASERTMSVKDSLMNQPLGGEMTGRCFAVTHGDAVMKLDRLMNLNLGLDLGYAGKDYDGGADKVKVGVDEAIAKAVGKVVTLHFKTAMRLDQRRGSKAGMQNQNWNNATPIASTAYRENADESDDDNEGDDENAGDNDEADGVSLQNDEGEEGCGPDTEESLTCDVVGVEAALADSVSADSQSSDSDDPAPNADIPPLTFQTEDNDVNVNNEEEGVSNGRNPSRPSTGRGRGRTASRQTQSRAASADYGIPDETRDLDEDDLQFVVPIDPGSAVDLSVPASLVPQLPVGLLIRQPTPPQPTPAQPPLAQPPRPLSPTPGAASDEQILLTNTEAATLSRTSTPVTHSSVQTASGTEPPIMETFIASPMQGAFVTGAGSTNLPRPTATDQDAGQPIRLDLSEVLVSTFACSVGVNPTGLASQAASIDNTESVVPATDNQIDEIQYTSENRFTAEEAATANNMNDHHTSGIQSVGSHDSKGGNGYPEPTLTTESSIKDNQSQEPVSIEDGTQNDDPELFASAENDFRSFDGMEATGPIIPQRERTDEDADALLEEVIGGIGDKAMGPNAMDDNISESPACTVSKSSVAAPCEKSGSLSFKDYPNHECAEVSNSAASIHGEQSKDEATRNEEQAESSSHLALTCEEDSSSAQAQSSRSFSNTDLGCGDVSSNKTFYNVDAPVMDSELYVREDKTASCDVPNLVPHDDKLLFSDKKSLDYCIADFIPADSEDSDKMCNLVYQNVEASEEIERQEKQQFDDDDQEFSRLSENTTQEHLKLKDQTSIVESEECHVEAETEKEESGQLQETEKSTLETRQQRAEHHMAQDLALAGIEEASDVKIHIHQDDVTNQVIFKEKNSVADELMYASGESITPNVTPDNADIVVRESKSGKCVNAAMIDVVHRDDKILHDNSVTSDELYENGESSTDPGEVSRVLHENGQGSLKNDSLIDLEHDIGEAVLADGEIQHEDVNSVTNAMAHGSQSITGDAMHTDVAKTAGNGVASHINSANGEAVPDDTTRREILQNDEVRHRDDARCEIIHEGADDITSDIPHGDDRSFMSEVMHKEEDARNDKIHDTDEIVNLTLGEDSVIAQVGASQETLQYAVSFQEKTLNRENGVETADDEVKILGVSSDVGSDPRALFSPDISGDGCTLEKVDSLTAVACDVTETPVSNVICETISNDGVVDQVGSIQNDKSPEPLHDSVALDATPTDVVYQANTRKDDIKSQVALFRVQSPNDNVTGQEASDSPPLSQEPPNVVISIQSESTHNIVYEASTGQMASCNNDGHVAAEKDLQDQIAPNDRGRGRIAIDDSVPVQIIPETEDTCQTVPDDAAFWDQAVSVRHSADHVVPHDDTKEASADVIPIQVVPDDVLDRIALDTSIKKQVISKDGDVGEAVGDKDIIWQILPNHDITSQAAPNDCDNASDYYNDSISQVAACNDEADQIGVDDNFPIALGDDAVAEISLGNDAFGHAASGASFTVQTAPDTSFTQQEAPEVLVASAVDPDECVIDQVEQCNNMTGQMAPENEISVQVAPEGCNSSHTAENDVDKDNILLNDVDVVNTIDQTGSGDAVTSEIASSPTSLGNDDQPELRLGRAFIRDQVGSPIPPDKINHEVSAVQSPHQNGSPVLDKPRGDVCDEDICCTNTTQHHSFEETVAVPLPDPNEACVPGEVCLQNMNGDNTSQGDYKRVNNSGAVGGEASDKDDDLFDVTREILSPWETDNEDRISDMDSELCEAEEDDTCETDTENDIRIPHDGRDDNVISDGRALPSEDTVHNIRKQVICPPGPGLSLSASSLDVEFDKPALIAPLAPFPSGEDPQKESRIENADDDTEYQEKKSSVAARENISEDQTSAHDDIAENVIHDINRCHSEDMGEMYCDSTGDTRQRYSPEAKVDASSVNAGHGDIVHETAGQLEDKVAVIHNDVDNVSSKEPAVNSNSEYDKLSEICDNTSVCACLQSGSRPNIDESISEQAVHSEYSTSSEKHTKELTAEISQVSSSISDEEKYIKSESERQEKKLVASSSTGQTANSKVDVFDHREICGNSPESVLEDRSSHDVEELRLDNAKADNDPAQTLPPVAKVILDATDLWLSKISDYCKSPDQRDHQQLSEFAARCKSEILAISQSPGTVSSPRLHPDKLTSHEASGSQYDETPECENDDGGTKCEPIPLSTSSDANLPKLASCKIFSPGAFSPRPPAARRSSQSHSVRPMISRILASRHIGNNNVLASNPEELESKTTTASSSRENLDELNKEENDQAEVVCENKDDSKTFSSETSLVGVGTSEGKTSTTLQNDTFKATEIGRGKTSPVKCSPRLTELENITQTVVCPSDDQSNSKFTTTRQPVSRPGQVRRTALSTISNKCETTPKPACHPLQTPTANECSDAGPSTSASKMAPTMSSFTQTEVVSRAGPQMRRFLSVRRSMPQGVSRNVWVEQGKSSSAKPSPVSSGQAEAATQMGSGEANLGTPQLKRQKMQPPKMQPAKTKPTKMMTMAEFERSQADRHLSQAFARIYSSKPYVDCHMDTRVMDKTVGSIRRRRERTNYNCLIALENVKFLEMLRYQKSAYERDQHLKDFKKNYKAMVHMGKHTENWPETRGVESILIKSQSKQEGARELKQTTGKA